MSTISTYILEFLKENNEVQIVDLGIFSMKNSAAKVVQENNNILPPAKEISLIIDSSMGNNGFAEYVASKQGLMYHEAMSLLRKTSDNWLSEAKINGQAIIEGLGVIHFKEDNFQFVGERLTVSSPDFFGLEEIDLEEIKGDGLMNNEESTENDSFGKTILWTFLVAIPVAGIIYLALTQKDKLLGKDSMVVKTATHRIPAKKTMPKVDSIKVDSLSTIKTDSISVSNKNKLQ